MQETRAVLDDIGLNKALELRVKLATNVLDNCIWYNIAMLKNFSIYYEL